MSERTSTVFVPLFGAKGKPPWHIGGGDQSWRLSDSPRTAAVLDYPVADLPDFGADVPYAPPPPPLASIDGMPVARGLALPWMRFTTIHDRTGHFRERFAPKSLSRTLAERENPLVGLCNHGQDMACGAKPLGKIQAWEDSAGLRFELAFLPVSYASDVASGARQGLYGASIRFSTTSERVNRRPGRSQGNPLGLEERTIQSARLLEISLTPLPAYGGTHVQLAG